MIRDIYLGHSCSAEMGYIMQMIPQWQRTFKETKALQQLDLTENVNTYKFQETLETQAKQIEDLKQQLQKKSPAPEDEETLKIILAKFREGKIHIDN